MTGSGVNILCGWMVNLKDNFRLISNKLIPEYSNIKSTITIMKSILQQIAEKNRKQEAADAESIRTEITDPSTQRITGVVF